MRVHPLCILAILVTLTSSCGGGASGVSETTPTIPTTTAAVATTTVTIANSALLLGQTTQVTVVTRDASGNQLSGRVISFSSSNNAVVTISTSGIVTSVGGGSATITATSEGVSGSASVTVTLAPIAAVTFAASSASILGGQTLQISPTPRDASGNALTGRTITFTSSNNSVGTISNSGLITALVAGSTNITATSEGVSGILPVTIVDPRIIPTFSRPFTDEFPVVNFMDHDIPKEFVDVNGTFMTFWGEAHPGLATMTDGHSGYDFLMPIGTPLFADAAGTVTYASLTSTSFFCPILNKNVTDQGDVYVEHRLIGGITIQSRYTHISRVDVAVGQQVVAGQQIALSGNTGCTSAPHLHYGVDRLTQTNNGDRTEIDPYGWTGAARDPWELSSIGATSINLWKPGQAPALFRQRTLALPATAISALAITKIVYEGVNDAVNPNNEYVEVTLDTRFATTASLNGYTLKGDASGFTFTFPNSITLTSAQPVLRVYTGSGTNTASTVYMGRANGMWSNLLSGDCARLIDGKGGQYRFILGGTCALP